MTIRVQLKRSSVKGKAPLPADLEYGELAVNYESTDPALYIKNSADAIVKLAPSAAPADASETVKGIVELATAAETTTGTDKTRAVHPQGLKVELDKKANQATTYTKTETNTALALKANLASPALTGTPTAPTAAKGTNTTQLATTAFVHAAVSSSASTPLPTAGALGFRNILINGDLRINQRGVTIAAAAVGKYGPDRWKKVDASHMTQIVADGNYKPKTVYTLSGTGVTTQQVTSPASGNWTIPSVPITATNIQLEEGTSATAFERRHYSAELLECQRYYLGFFGAEMELQMYVKEKAGNQIGHFYTTSTFMRAPGTVVGVRWTGGGGHLSQCVPNSGNRTYNFQCNNTVLTSAYFKGIDAEL